MINYEFFSLWLIFVGPSDAYPRKAAEDAMEASLRIENPVPWSHVPPFARLLLHDGGPNGAARFHHLDIWHCVHLGIGKSWCASGAMELQKLITESNVDRRLEVLSRLYKEFCKREHLAPVLTKIDIHTFGGPGVKERNGAWNKACVTSNMFLFLEDFCHQNAEKVQQNELLRIFVPVLIACCFELFVQILFFVTCTYCAQVC